MKCISHLNKALEPLSADKKLEDITNSIIFNEF